MERRATLVHLTTADLSLRFLLRDQLRRFREEGYEVIAMSAPGPWVADLQRDGVPHVAIPALRRRWAPLADARALAQLTTALRRIRPLIVHTHTPKAGVLGRLAARLAGVPVVVNTVHGSYTPDGRVGRRFFLSLERLAARFSDFELFQSREDLETLRRLRVVRPERSGYLGNGVDLREFDPQRVDRERARAALGVPRDAAVIGTVGRLVWEKGYREFFALAQALAGDPRVVVVAVGPREEGKEDGIPEAVLAELEGRGVVRFLGLRTDMPQHYAAMDIFVLPSYREGFPRSAIEAAAMGLPLILSDIRGCREVVAEGRNGFLVPPRDEAALLARVRQLLADPPARRALGEESRRRALREFDEEQVVRRTLDVYDRLLREGNRVRLHTHPQSTTGR